MSDKRGDDRPDTRPGEAVGQLVDSALRLSASVAQVVAEAATGRPQPNAPDETPLQSMIRHGTTAAGSMLATAVSAARNGTAASGGAHAKTAGSERAERPTDATPPVPKVEAGKVLRVPLSIDNPGNAAMENIRPSPSAVQHEGAPAEEILDVAFLPEALTIGPQDFEKLTVTVTVPENAPKGAWRLDFTLTGQEDQPITLAFEVV